MLAPAGSRLAPVLATPADVRRRAAADDCLAERPETLLKPCTAQASEPGSCSSRSRSMPASPLAAAAAAAAFGGQGPRAARLGFPLGSPTSEWLRDAAAAAQQGLRELPHSAPRSGQNPAHKPCPAAALRYAGAPGKSQLSGGGSGADGARESGEAQSGGCREQAGGRGGRHTGELRGETCAQGLAPGAGACPAAQGTAAQNCPADPAGSRAGRAAGQEAPASPPATASANASRRGAPGSMPALSAQADTAAPPRPGRGSKPYVSPGNGARARSRASDDEEAGLGPGPVFVPIVLCMDESDHALLVREWYERRQQVRLHLLAVLGSAQGSQPSQAWLGPKTGCWCAGSTCTRTRCGNAWNIRAMEAG